MSILVDLQAISLHRDLDPFTFVESMSSPNRMTNFDRTCSEIWRLNCPGNSEMLRISWCLEAMLKNQHHPKALDIPRLPNTTNLCVCVSFMHLIAMCTNFPSCHNPVVPSSLPCFPSTSAAKATSFEAL